MNYVLLNNFNLLLSYEDLLKFRKVIYFKYSLRIIYNNQALSDRWDQKNNSEKVIPKRNFIGFIQFTSLLS